MTYVELRRVGSWLDEVPWAPHQFILGLAPCGAPVSQVPSDYRDYTRAVRSYLGAAPPGESVGLHRPATVSVPAIGC